MRIYLVILTLISIVIGMTFSACKKKKEVAVDTTKPSPENIQPAAAVKDPNEIKLLPIQINSEYSWPGSTDPFEILSSEIKGDMLVLEVQYGGGCQEHDFTMTTNMMWMKSMPPQLNLYLEHENHDDNCRALITQKLAFDLSACRYNNGNVVVLIINGDRDKSKRYQY
jgi:hypothetical protein